MLSWKVQVIRAGSSDRRNTLRLRNFASWLFRVGKRNLAWLFFMAIWKTRGVLLVFSFLGHLFWRTSHKNWKWGFNTFAGVFDARNGRIGPAVLEVQPVISGEVSNAACDFFRITFWKIVDTLQFPDNQFRTRSIRKMPPLSDETSRYSWKSLTAYFLREWQHRRKIERCQGRKNRSRYLSPKDRKCLRRAT